MRGVLGFGACAAGFTAGFVTPVCALPCNSAELPGCCTPVAAGLAGFGVGFAIVVEAGVLGFGPVAAAAAGPTETAGLGAAACGVEVDTFTAGVVFSGL